MPAALHSGLYINLDRSTERRQCLEGDIARLGLTAHYRRVPAVDGATLEPKPRLNVGEIGCYHSHLNALAIAAQAKGVTHVLEDDTTLSPRMPAVVAAAIEGRLLDQVDIIFLDLILPHDPALWAHYRRQMKPGQLSVLSLAGCAFWAMASYVVSPRSAKRIAEVCIEEMARRPRPIDVLVRDAVNTGRLRAVAILPFVTTLRLDQSNASTIGPRTDNPSPTLDLAMNVLRYTYFADATREYLRPFVQTLRGMIAAAPDRQDSKAAQAVLDFIGA
jgi:GR25 family glycosyltransferase involved in LPS biosynthesis